MKSRRRVIATIVILSFVACGKTAERPSAPTSDRVSFDGYNDIRIGGTLRNSAASREQLACRVTHPASWPAGAAIMVVNDTIARIQVDSAGVLTTEGAGVGDPEARILELYRGRVVTEPHKYIEGHYLVVTSLTDSMRRMVFETDGKRVLSYRAGLRPAVDYVEGCG